MKKIVFSPEERNSPCQIRTRIGLGLKKKLVVVVGILSVTTLALVGLSHGQDPLPYRDSGYVRPGNPSDEVLADLARRKEAFAGKVMGGTIYAGVFQQGKSSAPGDPWNTGMKDFAAKFKGKETDGLDTKAPYIYLYQIVNDRFMTSPPAAGTPTPATADVNTFTIKLPRNADITSVGWFSETGFKAQNVAVSAVDGIEPKLLLQNKTFEPAKSVFTHFELGVDSRNLNLQDAVKLLGKKDEKKLLESEKNFLLAATGKATGEPDSVEIISRASSTAAEFRVTWAKNKSIKQGQQSVLIGFTSRSAVPPPNTGLPCSSTATGSMKKGPRRACPCRRRLRR